MVDIIQDVSNITRVPISTINKLIDISTSIISNDVLDAYNKREKFSEFDLGIGKLIIFNDSSSIEYRFIPAKDFERKINSCIKDNKSVLVDELEKSLVDKLLLSYKELF